MRATHGSAGEHNGHQHERVDDGRHSGPGAGANVHRRPGDGPGGGHPTEKRRNDVGQALPEQLAVGIVTGGVGHPVSHLRRQEALDGHQGRDRKRGAEQIAHPLREPRKRRPRQRRWQRADPGDVDPGQLGGDGSHDHGEERRRQRPVEPREQDHHRGNEHHQRPGGERAVSSKRIAHRPSCHEQRLLPVWRGHTKGRRHLLEQDYHGDADGEALK